MADRLLLESGSPDGYLLEDGTGVVLLQDGAYATLLLSLNPIAWWRLGEASGTVAVDAMGANPGAYVAAPTLGVTGNLTGDDDTAVTLDGSTEYITVPDGAALDQGNGPLSWTLWIKRSTPTGGFFYIMSKGTGAPGFYFDDTDLAFLSYATGAGATSTVPLDDTDWHFIVGTKTSGDVWKIYVDGVDTTASSTATPTNDTTDPLLIGDDFINGDPFPGSLDEVALFNSVLTPTNVSDLYAAATNANKLATPTTAALVLTTFAPTVTTPQTVTPTTAALVTTTFAPTVTASDHKTVTPTTASLTTATFAPTVTATAHQTVTPTTAALTLTSFAPSVLAPRLATPTTVALTTTTFAPTVTASDHKTATPTTAALSTTTFAPTVSTTAHVTATPTTAALTTSTFAPTVTATAHQTVTPTTLALLTDTFAPTVTASDHKTVTPTTAALSTSAFAPTVTASDHKTVTPTTASLTLTTFAPVVAAGVLAVPTTASLNLATFAPTVTATQNRLVIPAPASLTLTRFAPTVTATGAPAPPVFSPSAGGIFDTKPYIFEFYAPVSVFPQPAHLSTTTYPPSVRVALAPDPDVEELLMMGAL